MSSTVYAPYKDLGKNGDYPVEMNYGIRIYDNKGEFIPPIGQLTATLKGGLRTNHLGEVPLLDGNKDRIGVAEVLKIISAKPENMDLEYIQACGFNTVEAAVEYVEKEHGEEYNRDGVMTIYFFKVVRLDR